MKMSGVIKLLSVKLILIGICTLFSANAFAGLAGELYKNDNYKFKIKFPHGWTVAKVEDVSNVITGSNADGCTITVDAWTAKDFPVQDIAGLSKEDVDAVLSGAMKGYINNLKASSPGIKILNTSQNNLGNKKAITVKYSHKLQINSELYPFIAKAYITIHKGYIYVVSYGVLEKNVHKEKELQSYLSTFQFTSK
jgi:hypothetical protein